VPRAKRDRDRLPAGLRFYLAFGRVANIGEDPDVPHGFDAGNFEAFQLWGRVLQLGGVTDLKSVIEELEDLWRRHAVKIRAAAGDQKPWVETFLRQRRSKIQPEAGQ
jgi:hypothetical protein